MNMKHNIKEYKINIEDSGRLTLKLELELQKRGEERTAFATREALQLLVDEGYCNSINEIRIVKHGVAYNWGGSQSKDDWTFVLVDGTKKWKKQSKPAIATSKPEPKKTPTEKKKAATKPEVKKKEPVAKPAAKKTKTTKRTTQDILARINKSKGD